MKISITHFIVSIAIAMSLSASVAAADTPTSFLKVGDGSIAYEDTGGAGPLVICLPGLGDLRQQYRFLAPALNAAGYRVVTMDLRGMGESSAEWPDYSAAAEGKDIVALLSHLGARQAVVVGNSMTGASAVWAAAEVPDRINGIILIDPFVRDMPVSWAMSMLLKVAFVRPWGVAAWLAYYGSLYPTSKPADFDDYRAALRRNLSEAGRLDALHAQLDASKAECESRIPDVKAPVLVIMGSKDPDFADPAAEGKLVADRLHGKLVIIEGAGHYPHAEMPREVEPAIIDFLGALNGGKKIGA